MKKEIIDEGVVAKYDGKYWGTQYSDSHSTNNDFGEFDKAHIANPKYCKKPTDMTHNPKNTLGYNPDYDKLLKATLIPVRKITTIQFVELDNV